MKRKQGAGTGCAQPVIVRTIFTGIIPSEPSGPHIMNRRPLSVTVISWLFIAAGVIGLAYHATELRAEDPFQYDLGWVFLLRLLAILCGVFMLRGSDWARWLLLAWITYHVILSAFHSLSELAMHSLLLVVIAFFLLRPAAAAYFRGARGDAEPQEGRPAGKARRHGDRGE